MKLVFLAASFFSLSTSFGQKNEYQKAGIIKENVHFKENIIYIFARGTSAKAGIIADRFNISDRNITHVGIGYLDKKNILIYNVCDIGDKNKNALVLDSLESFTRGNDVYYFSVWEAAFSVKNFKKLRACLRAAISRHIYFDHFFKLQEDDTLYCSEFCIRMLQKTDSVRYSFKPVTVTLNNVFYESILDRKELVYYPVDLFEENRHLKKLFEVKY